MPTNTWKNDETWFARFLGYIGRNALSGGNSKAGTTGDNHIELHPSMPEGLNKVYIEAKRKKGGSFLANLYVKEVKKAEKEGKILVLAFAAHGKKFIFMEAKDLLKVAKQRKAAKKIDWEDFIRKKKRERKGIRTIKM